MARSSRSGRRVAATLRLPYLCVVTNAAEISESTAACGVIVSTCSLATVDMQAYSVPKTHGPNTQITCSLARLITSQRHKHVVYSQTQKYDEYRKKTDKTDGLQTT